MCAVTDRAELVLPAVATSAARAREFVRDNSCVVHDLQVLDHALLLTSELVTNSIKYGGDAPIHLALDCHEDSLCVRVRDASSTLPTRRAAGNDDESGRGLAFVEMLSDAWGAEPVTAGSGPGKVVWFRLGSPADQR